MYYIIYIDVYFFMNFFMNIVLLFLLNKVEGEHFFRRKKCFIIGAFIGSLLSCLFMITNWKISFVPRFFLVHGIIGYVMIRITFHYKTIKQRIYALVKLNLLEMIMSGILNMLIKEEAFWNLKTTNTQTVENQSIYKTIGITVFFAIVLMRFFEIYKTEAYTQNHLYDLKICYNGKSCEGIGFLDTGNHLRDPISKKPVIIANLKAVHCLFEKELLNVFCNVEKMKDIEGIYKIRWIPYHSLGKKNGFLIGIIVDELIVYKEGKELVNKEVLLGVIEEELSNENLYQFILHEEYLID